ncbi:class I SAM-dependent methyltransferase [Microtetraspora niveoalba]|uniref:class I SAM-dependent methyltransferase n=1 Tax=Microtetraspora niveoalba TaxID=46175 RepID=UPI00082DFF2A|nr:class I SAM-dependent methyltransferase [Microtetraspora niveoalba]
MTGDAHGTHGTHDVSDMSAEEYWNHRYSESDRIWSGNPNAALVHETAGLPVGRALDLGCGEGADAVWLARQGWHVTAVDISQVALDRGAAHAEAAGVADLVDWQRHDLSESFPSGVFDLVSAHFLHSRVELPREEILRRAAAAVAPGGALLVVGHSGVPHWQHDGHADMRLPTTEEVLKDLDLPDGEWEVLVGEERERVQTGHDGEQRTLTDSVLKVRRRPAD